MPEQEWLNEGAKDPFTQPEAPPGGNMRPMKGKGVLAGLVAITLGTLMFFFAFILLIIFAVIAAVAGLMLFRRRKNKCQVNNQFGNIHVTSFRTGAIYPLRRDKNDSPPDN